MPKPSKPPTAPPPPPPPDPESVPASAPWPESIPARPPAPKPSIVLWMDAFPDVEGWYWFYGWRDPLDIRRHEPKMYFVQASIGPTKRMMYLCGNEHIYREAIGRWLPADIPAAPDMTAYKA